MSRTLRRDVYGIYALGYPIERVQNSRIQTHYRRHATRVSTGLITLCDWNSNSCANHWVDLQDGGIVDVFIKKKYLYWLEALSLSNSMSEGVVSMASLSLWCR